MKNTDQLFIKENDSIIYAVERMDAIKRKLLIVLQNNRFFSLLSIGDIQRAIIAKTILSESVEKIVRPSVRVAKEGDDLEKVKERMRIMRTEFMPVLSIDNTIKEIIFWEDLFVENKTIEFLPQAIPVVIMAGGKGSRLAPLTNILPKPLIPIGKKTIIEEIMDRFVQVGCNSFFLSVNYKVEMIKHYFSVLNNLNYTIEYFQEDKPLGTAGSMFLLKDKITTSFFVSNCDILIDQDLLEVYKYHKTEKNDITVVSALKNIKIPYGTIETGNNGKLNKISEKPELTFQINTGLYLLEPHLLDLIPENSFYHITELIEKIQLQGKVGVFPVSEGSWLDIGDWSEYTKFIANGNK